VALAPADFYAYSRATGQPYPESPEERAQQAPQVLEFRRNQLKAPETNNSNPVALGFGIALGLAGLGGAGLAARRMLRSGKSTGQSGVYKTDLSEYEPQVRQAGTTKPPFVKPSKVAADAPSAPVQRTVDINAEVDDEVTRLLNDPDLLKFVEAEEAAIINRQPEIRAEQSRQQAQVRRALSARAEDIRQELLSEPTNSLVNQQQATGGFNVKQAISALESGEDQQTGRMKNQLQRNEDLDMGQVEVLEDIASQQRNFMMEQDEPINSIASQLPDGRPLDQSEGLDLQTGERFAIRQGSTVFAPRSTLGATGLVPGQRILLEQEPQSVANTSAVRFMEAERDKISRELNIDGVPASSQRVDAELARRLGPQASTYGPKYTARAQALQTFANTGDPIAAETIKRFGLSPVTFETFENMPAAKKRLFESAAPMSLEGYPSTELQAVVNPTGIKVNAPGFGVVDISTLRKPVVMESTARQADKFIKEAKADKLDWVQGKINEINEARQGILLERKERIKTAADNLLVKLEQAKASGQNNVVDELENQLDNLRTMYRNPELVGDYKEFGKGGMRHLNAQLQGVQRSTNQQIAGLEKRYPTTLANRTGEASRVFGELDVNTGEFIPETMEVRSGRSDVDLGRKGGGGRNIAEYTAGERLDEEIRALQGGGRIRDYDLETGAPVQRWQGDSTQTGRTIDEYGIRLTRQRAADPEVRPSVPQYTQQEIGEEALRLSKADPYGDVPVAPEYAEVVESLGYQQPTPERRASVLLSEQVRKGQRSFPKQNINSYPSSILARPVRINFPEETIKPSPVQLSFPSDVVPATAAAARVRVTPADQAAQQLEAYMGRLQRGRTSPLTSQVRIQPSLF